MLIHADEAVGVAVGEGFEQDSVDDAEDGAGGADAERQGGDGGGREAPVASERRTLSICATWESAIQIWRRRHYQNLLSAPSRPLLPSSYAQSRDLIPFRVDGW